jgi:hypothetical protein
VGLLERGELAHHKVGTHRRVRFSDLMAYKQEQLGKSKARLAELAKLDQELGLH